MENLVVTILPEDFKNAPLGYHNGTLGEGCVLWHALTRLFPTSQVYVSPWSVRVGEIFTG